MPVTSTQIARALHELIEALDRRVPRVEQAGEASIAREADALRARAMKRLAELEDPTGPAPLDSSERVGLVSPLIGPASKRT